MKFVLQRFICVGFSFPRSLNLCELLSVLTSSVDTCCIYLFEAVFDAQPSIALVTVGVCHTVVKFCASSVVSFVHI